jgi:hypothetical protein
VGDWSARGLVNATGTWDRPFVPRYPGQRAFRGRQLHTAGYRGPADFVGRRVVVVGGGTSAVQALLELESTAASATWVTRREPVFRVGGFGADEGRAAVARVAERVERGLPPRSVVSVTGLWQTEAVAAARERGLLRRLPMFDRITPDGVAWDDGRFVAADTILWATGFRPALSHLAPLHLRAPGGGIRLDGAASTRVSDDPRVHLVGYGPSASTIGANRAGRAAVRELLETLGWVGFGGEAADRDGTDRPAHGPATPTESRATAPGSASGTGVEAAGTPEAPTANRATAPGNATGTEAAERPATLAGSRAAASGSPAEAAHPAAHAPSRATVSGHPSGTGPDAAASVSRGRRSAARPARPGSGPRQTPAPTSASAPARGAASPPPPFASA